CMLELPAQILSVTCGGGAFQERCSGLANLLVASCLAELRKPHRLGLTRVGQIIEISGIYSGDVPQRARVYTIRGVLAVMVSLHSAAAVCPHRGDINHRFAQVSVRAAHGLVLMPGPMHLAKVLLGNAQDEPIG